MKAILIVGTLLLHTLSFAQGEGETVYTNLDTVEFYAVSTHHTNVSGSDIYEVDGKRVSKKTYNKYAASWDDMGDCCPCYLLRMDIKGRILKEGVACTDAWIGVYLEHDIEGDLLVSGQYKEVADVTHENLGNRYNKKHGNWCYFDTNGDTLYYEVWKNGRFIEQIPELRKMEIWDVNITYRGKSIEGQKIPIGNVGQIEFTPEFKNSNEVTEFTITFTASAIGFVQNKRTMTLEEFKSIDVKAMMKEKGFSKRNKPYFHITILADGNYVGGGLVKIKL
ncbi:MAG: hypothetical protein QNK23_11080 [Crocinitomicaceae bacterium]|nr:hypothetical protein [Crocinitomicaceae bacterium]